MFKRIKFIVIAAAVALGVFLFFSDDEPGFTPDLIGESGDPDQTWSVYWYLCGSDLESEVGAASSDLEEMMSVSLPDNVNVVIETGGARHWENDFVKHRKNQRYLYSSSGLELVDEVRRSNMGDPDTLADFLRFCKKNYPADRTMVILWNHGGGSVAGVSFDETHGYDSLTLDELYKAFDSVYPLSQENPPIDIIGFDACLMATIDTAYTFSDIARYMVASEDQEPGSGWAYDRFLKELAHDPGMDGARLGQKICDTYMDSCGWLLEDEATLSVVDLGRINPLYDAYDNMGAEALTEALDDPRFFSRFGREAENSENYGGNTRDQGYTNMVDLGHLAENCSDLLPHTAQAVRDGLEECVIYQVKGDYRANASGLSCFYSYNGDRDNLEDYMTQGCSPAFKYLYDYGFWGELPPEGMEYIDSLGFDEETLPEIPDLTEDGEKEYPLYFDEDDYVTMKLDPRTADMLKGVYFQLAYIDPEEDIILMLGQDNDIDADWENGIFRDNFRGVWGAIDGCPVYMEVSFDDEDFTFYSVPILLNGEEYSLQVVYDFSDEEFHILGARRGLDSVGMADKNIRKLEPGDEITTVHYTSSISGSDDFEAVPVDTLTVTEDTVFEEVDMGDGIFLMMFELVDSKNNTAYSQVVQFTVEGDYMDIEILD